MPTPMQQHPSATVRAGTTLVPETVDVVSAFLRRTPMQEADVHRLLRDVHATLVGIAADSGAVADDLHRIGYQPHPAAEDGVVDVGSVAARLFGTPQAPARPRPVALPAPASAPEPIPARAPAPLPAAETRDDVVVPFRRTERKAKAPEAKPSQIELPIGPSAPVPAKGVTVRTSVEMEWLVCLEDGKKTRDLARHLSERYGMSPDEYRAKWGLPASYPMRPPAAIQKNGEAFEFEPLSGTFRRLRK